MYVKKLKRKCSVRGCNCKDSYAISLTREMGNSVIICKSCLGKALGSIDDIDPETKSNFPKESLPTPPLFFNAEALGLNKPVEAPQVQEAPETPADDGKQTDNPPVTGENDGTEDGKAPVAPTDDDSDAPADDETPETDTDEQFKCPQCGKAFGNEKGLKAHLRYCKQQNEE